MAEAIAAISAVASITQLVDFAAKIVERLATYHDKSNNLPGAFQQIHNQLPLLLEILKGMQDDINAGAIRKEVEKAVLPVINGCKKQIESLGKILDKLVPSSSDSRPETIRKAFSSLKHESETTRITSALGSYIQTLTFYHSATRSTLNTLKDQRLIKIRQWLSAPDPSSNYEKALGLRQAGTGIWFLESEQYKNWKSEASSFIWLHGIPGCGKTVLSSVVVEDVYRHCEDDPGRAIAYYYFDFKELQKQSSELMIKSLLTQLSYQCIKIPQELGSFFGSSDNWQRQPSTSALLPALQQMVKEFPATYIILDALDECTDREDLMVRIETIASWNLENLHIIVTSRKEREIESLLESIVESDKIISLKNALVDEDIRKYVSHRLSVDKKLEKWRGGEMQAEIENALMKGAHGMFRWAVCQLDSLGKCVSKAMLRKALKRLPSTLDETYERILCNINEDHSTYALRIMQWLAFSLRPLSIDELAEVVAIDPENDPAFDKDEVLEDPLDAVNICGSLLTVRSHKETDFSTSKVVISFAHYSVKEYLTSDRIQKGPAKTYSLQDCDSHSMIGNSCIGYLLQFHDTDSFSPKTVVGYKLARYSAEFWVEHVCFNSFTELSAQKLAMKLFSIQGGAYLNWIRIHDLSTPSRKRVSMKQASDVPPPLYYASLAGLTECVRDLMCDVGVDVEARHDDGNTALWLASFHGHQAIAKLLIDGGADVNTRGDSGRTALWMASLYGHEAIVKLLLDGGADVNMRDNLGYTPIRVAATFSYQAIVKLLLDAGVDVNELDDDGHTALWTASTDGNEAIVKLLLDAGADVNVRDKDGNTALGAALAHDCEAIAKLLLDTGAISEDLNSMQGSE